MTPPFDRVRRVLDRGPARRPPPPRVYEPTARLVYTDLGLPELFAHAAARGGLAAELVHVEDLAAAVADHLPTAGPRVQRRRVAAAPQDPAGRRPGRGSARLCPTGRRRPGLVTGCDAAVAETGSLVYRGGLPAGWSAAAARVVVRRAAATSYPT